MPKTFLISLLFSSLVYAQDYDTFIGLEAGRTQLNIEPDLTDKGADYGARIGFVNKTGRVFLSLNTADLDNTSIHSAALNFDAITAGSYRFNEYFSLRALVGLHGGFTRHDPDNLAKSEGVMGGAKAGLLLDFPAEISLEVGYKGSWADIEYGDEKIKNYQNLYLAFDFVF